MWYCDDDLNTSDSDLDDVMASNDSNKKPPGYYVRREMGLFPSPLPQVLKTFLSENIHQNLDIFFDMLGWGTL